MQKRKFLLIFAAIQCKYHIEFPNKAFESDVVFAFAYSEFKLTFTDLFRRCSFVQPEKALSKLPVSLWKRPGSLWILSTNRDFRLKPTRSENQS